MEPKAKAYELVHKFKMIDESEIYGDRLGKEPAKECAIITVDEILSLRMIGSIGRGMDEQMNELEFWIAVRKEIEKL